MINPTVSIILPNRNYAPFIPDAIASIKAQTLADWECIIVDDASTDNSVDVFRAETADDDRFKIVTNAEPIGISAARNVGMDMATGEYITFLDSDDCYAEYFLEMLVKLARETKVDVAGALNKIVPEDYHFQLSDTKWNTTDYVMFDDPLKMLQEPQNRKCIWVWRRIYKRSLLKDVRFRKEMKVNGDDVMFILDLLWRVPRIAESNIEAIYHRVHTTSITSRFNIERVRMFPTLFRFIRDELLDKYKKELWEWYYPGLFLLMLNEGLVRFADDVTKQDEKELRKILSRACKYVVKEQLPTSRHRLLCRYLRWIG